MFNRISRSIRARSLAGLITAVEIEIIGQHANSTRGPRVDALRITREALMTSWRTLYSKLGDPFEYKQAWDSSAEAKSSKNHSRVVEYTGAIMGDLSPAFESLLAALRPTAEVINPNISARYAVMMS